MYVTLTFLISPPIAFVALSDFAYACSKWKSVSEFLLIGSVFLLKDFNGVACFVGLTILLFLGTAFFNACEYVLLSAKDNLQDHYVGTGGLPNARGEVELDASIMVGSTRAFAALSAVDPLAIVFSLDYLHTVLFGEGFI